MNSFTKEIGNRIEFLKNIILEKEKALRFAPVGSINICGSVSRRQFYHLKEGEKPKYLKNSEKNMIQRLCQKDYDQKILEAARQELSGLESLYRNMKGKFCEDIYENLHEERKKAISPIWLPDEEYIEQWENVSFQSKGFREETPEFYTDKGERVRSKTEILLANTLKKYNIPYRYEAPLKLKGYTTIHPDFTVLHVRLRKEIYWEHMGMLDDEKYLENALDRINWYIKNEIYPGDGLFLTYETKHSPINIKLVEKMILHQFV